MRAEVVSIVLAGASLTVSGVALFFSLRRDRKALTVRGRTFAIEPDPGMPYLERHIEIIASNNRHRPITVIELGMWMTNGNSRWKRIDGRAHPRLPVTLGDGDIAVMKWVTTDEGRANDKDVSVTEVFARAANGKTVRGKMLRDPDADFSWA